MEHIWNTVGTPGTHFENIWNTFGTRLEHIGNTCNIFGHIRIGTHLGEHLWETTESVKAFFVNLLCLGNRVQGLGEPVPRFRGNRFPGPGQPISILDYKNPKGKPGWGKIQDIQFLRISSRVPRKPKKVPEAPQRTPNQASGA